MKHFTPNELLLMAGNITAILACYLGAKNCLKQNKTIYFFMLLFSIFANVVALLALINQQLT